MLETILKVRIPLERPSGVSKFNEFLIMLSMIFSSFVFFKQPFEFYFHYIIFLGLIPFLFLKYSLPQFVLKIFLYTLLVGVFTVVINGFPWFQFIKVWGGLVLSLSFYSLVIQYFKGDYKYLFYRFVHWTYITALIGVIQVLSFYLKFGPAYKFNWILNKWSYSEGGIFGLRINSIYSEPSTVAVVLAPLVYIALYNLIHKRGLILNKIQSLIVLLVYVGSGSSTAYIGLFIILILVTDGLKLRYAFIGFTIAAIFGWGLYKSVGEFSSRVDSSINLWIYQNYSIENTNTSSFVLYNNFNVALGSFSENPIIGTGPGSYEYAYERHTLTRSVISYDFEFNKSDGNSMFLRLMVETGLVGLIFVFLVISKSFVPKVTSQSNLIHRVISHGILTMILLYLLRQGNYFLNALPFFYLVYFYNGKEYKRKQIDSLQK